MNTLPFPAKLEEMTLEEEENLRKKGFSARDYLRINPGGFLFPRPYRHFGPLLYNFEHRTDDVLVLSSPKSGTNWTVDLIWSMMNPNELHILDQKNIQDRTIFMDTDFYMPMTPEYLERFNKMCPGAKQEDGVIIKLAQAETSPRLLWSHRTIGLHNPDVLSTCKVVCVARNPKDVLVSGYHFYKGVALETIPTFTGDFKDYVEAAMEEVSPPINGYWEHLRQSWQQRNHPNFHFLFYEDMKKDAMSEAKKLKDFLKLDLTEEQMSQILEATSFNNMKAREKKLPVFHFVNNMFRKGEIGDAKNMFTPELDSRVNAWIKENSEGIDIEFKYH